MILLVSLTVLLVTSLVTNIILFKSIKGNATTLNSLNTTNKQLHDAFSKIQLEADEFRLKVLSLNSKLNDALGKIKQTPLNGHSSNGSSVPPTTAAPTAPTTATKPVSKKRPQKKSPNKNNPNNSSSSK
jgi:hypothetical protein